MCLHASSAGVSSADHMCEYECARSNVTSPTCAHHAPSEMCARQRQGLDDGAARLQRMLSTDANGGRRPSQDAKEAAYQRRITELEAQARWKLC